ncbi:MAG: hypothetical protein K0S47_3905 [Herbinix sp.]|jgi:hypothetical protein|nr:hypothetical protein [Herbinix sp.]
MKAILPFNVNYAPITKLALINFEKKPDQVYSGLELQYIDGDPLGKGYRVIAYRNDKYVDVYDEETINIESDERFDVTQKGLKNHVHRHIEDICFDRINGNLHISFSFMDCDNRKIEVDIVERSKKKSIPMNLLAPIGVGSEKPSYLPVFFLYDFDFLRRYKTETKVLIDGVKMMLDPFPFPIPMNMQWRYYTRYSLDCQILEFLSSDIKEVRTLELNEENKYRDGVVEYQFTQYNGEMALSTIDIKNITHPLRVVFHPPISMVSQEGKFHIIPESKMGSINGSYQVTEDGENIGIKVIPEQGWTSMPNSTITKLIMSEKSVFCNWSKKYVYEQNINRANLSTEVKWTNHNITLKGN